MSQINNPVSVPWSQDFQKRGHPWHSMCSYLGSFPPLMAYSLISLLTDQGDTVLDPFCGRGTTHVECRLLDRLPLSSDLNPLAVAITKAKNTSVSFTDVISRIDELEQNFDLALYLPEALAQQDEIQLIFHSYVLAKLCYLRRNLLNSDDPVDVFLTGAALGIMHGSERKDGSSGYASISMPNTFSMSPNYVRRFVQEKRLQRVDRDIFQLLRDKAGRLLKDNDVFKIGGAVEQADAKNIEGVDTFQEHIGKVKLILTSPPYLNVVNYAKQNWIRMWFLKEDFEEVSSRLDDNLTLGSWIDFMEEVVVGLKKFLRSDGVIVLVVGDVARSSTNVISPARELIRRFEHDELFSYIGCISDHLNVEGKTTRVWKDTKGKATAIDRVLILSNNVPKLEAQGITGPLFESGEGARFEPELYRTHAREFAGLIDISN